MIYIYYQFDKWLNGDIANLLIVGLSGAGKTTLTNKLFEDHNCDFIGTDDLFSKHSGEFKKRTGKKIWEITEEEFYQIDLKVISDVKKLLNTKRKKIIEGIHILGVENDILKNQAIIIKNTSYFKAFFRTMKRDGRKYLDRGLWRFYDHYKYLIGQQYRLETDLNKLRKFINMEKKS